MRSRAGGVVVLLAVVWSLAYSEYTVQTVQLPSGFVPEHPIYNDTYRRLYVRARNQNLIASIGVARAELDTIVSVDGPARALWCDEARDLLYCISGSNYNSYISVLDCATNQLLNCVRTDWTPLDITGDSITGRVFVSYLCHQWVKAYGPLAESVVGWVITREFHDKVYFNGAVDKLYCNVLAQSCATSVVDCSTYSLRGFVLRGVLDFATYISPYNAKLYRGAAYIYVLDPFTDSVRIAHDTLGGWECFAHNPREDLVFAGCAHERIVKILDGTTDSVVGEFRPPTGHDVCVYEMAFDTAQNVLLLASSFADGVYVYSGSGDSLLETVDMPDRPNGLLCLPDGTFCVRGCGSLTISIAYPASGLAEPSSLAMAARAPAAVLVTSQRDVALSEPSLVYDMAGRRVGSSYGAVVRMDGLRSGVYELLGLQTGERRRLIKLMGR